MRRELPEKLERGRIAGPKGERAGAFIVRCGSAQLRIILSNGMGWDHVSVSLNVRCPTWDEMCWVKDLCFEASECVMQLHPPKSDYVNNHPFCLHLWRPQSSEEMSELKDEWGSEWDESWVTPGEIPRPPSITVGVKSLGLLS